jgi:hypothetical protein
MSHEAILQHIRNELQRIGASKVQVALDSKFEPKAGELVQVQLEGAEWRLLPAELEQLLQGVAAGAGDEGVRKAIETQGANVWHGPAPKDSRDSSHQPG